MFPAINRIAQIKTYFLEDDAISLNRRKYPAESVNRLVQSAQAQLTSPDSLPLTCYLSHEDADGGVTRNLVGKIVDVGKEGGKAFARIDIPDTSAGRDAATLIHGGYIRSMSLRASNAEMFMDKNDPMPLVGGSRLQLDGIDFTTSPGLPQVARIADITESHTPQSLNEVFNASQTTLLIEENTASPKEQPMTEQEKAALKAALLEELKAQQAQTSPNVDEAMRALQAAGYAVQAPKTSEQLLQDKLDAMQSAMQAAFEQKLTAMQEALMPRKPGRKSLVEGSSEGAIEKKPYYRKGDYLREQLHDPKLLMDLCDRSKPLPQGMDPERALKELEMSFMGIMDNQHSFDGL